MDLMSLKPLAWLLCLVPLGIVLKFSLVDRPRLLKGLATGLRLSAMGLLVLAMCQPFLALSSDNIHVVFLLDVSDSVDLTSARTAVKTIEACTETLSHADSWSMFLLADGLRSIQTPQEAVRALDGWQQPIPDQGFRSATRLADALSTVRLCFPADKARRIALFTDGCPTHGALDNVLATLQQEQTDLQLYRLSGLKTGEACIAEFQPSTTEAFNGEMLRLTATIRTNQPMPATLRLINNGVVASHRDLVLDPNEDNTVHMEVPMLTSGASRWTAELTAEQDHFLMNNTATCTVNVHGKPHILVIHQTPLKLRAFDKALTEQRFDVDVRGTFGLPEDLAALLAYDAVILADVAATDLSPHQMALLKRYVIDFGGGLAMFGSNNSFGLGGYHRTPVEEVLPLNSRFEKQQEEPSVAMVLVMDKSGSMQGLPIALSRQAAKATVDLLGPQDHIGVVAFDGQAFVVSPMRRASEGSVVKQAIDTLASGGGTFMYPGLETAFTLLQSVSAKIKHVILLSDGQSQPADHQGLVALMAQAGITVSTIALGQADRALLSSLAEIGKGRFYETNDPSQIPQIFTRDTLETSRTAVKEDLFHPIQISDHPLLAGFDQSALPVVFGHVMTHVKPATQLLLVTHAGDPLLAVSRHGLGTSLAYTSDVTEKWGSQWLTWHNFGRFWSQALRGILRRQSSEGLLVQQTQERDQWALDITRVDELGQPVSRVDFKAQRIGDSGPDALLPVEEVGLGRYRLTLPIERDEPLSLRLEDVDHSKTATLHYDRPYPEEYRLAGILDPSLAAVRALRPDSIRDNVTPAITRRPVSHLCYLLALLAMLAGLLFRRI